MSTIRVMVNGAPGKVASLIIRHILNINDDVDYTLVPYSLTGPEITAHEYVIDEFAVYLIPPLRRYHAVKDIRESEGGFICVDFTHPAAVNKNAEFYCEMGIPFVMGTTGGNRELLHKTVENSDNVAVIAPNMAKQIVGIQAMMEYAAVNFPGLFENFSITVRESHQKGKADTSGTAKAMIEYFNRLGCKCTEDDIRKERDPEVQMKAWGIPREHLKGHAWHTYTLVSNDGSMTFELTHNINGRDIYAKGTLDAVAFLHEKVRQGVKGKVFSMIDVLKGA